jgi:hypothetical protein
MTSGANSRGIGASAGAGPAAATSNGIRAINDSPRNGIKILSVKGRQGR